jgi:hypothetical protein
MKPMCGIGVQVSLSAWLEAMLAIETWRLFSLLNIITRLCADVFFCVSGPAVQPAASTRYHDHPDSRRRSTVDKREIESHLLSTHA